MAARITLRTWQRDALGKLAASERRDFLAVATPGAGKTTFALVAALEHLRNAVDRNVVIVAPTQHLKEQWREAAGRFGLDLATDWSARDGAPPPDAHGLVVTYQQVATSAAALRPLADGSFVVFDEIHHAGDDRAWGSSVLHAFAGAGRRLGLSGTPFRSDTSAIPFVEYRLDEAVADFEYGYADALADRRVVRPVFFPRVDGFMEWTAPDGSAWSATFTDELAREAANQRLRTALSLEGEWLPTVLSRANERLMEVRRAHPEAAGLVIATDQEHARGIADVLRRRCGTEAVVATSDDPAASERIARFARSTTPWIVAVRMISEGVDIPRLRIGVFATTTTTELFFRQAVGRLVRWTPGVPRQRSWLFIPDDPRLRRHAATITEHRRHALRPPPGDDPDAATTMGNEGGERPETADEDAQLSLFTVIGAVALDERGSQSPEHLGSVFDDDSGHWDGAGPGSEEHEPSPGSGTSGELDIEIVVPPRRGAGPTTRSRRELRELNSQAVRALAFHTGRDHAQINAELNRRVGIGRITEATAAQLERRLAAADRWLQRGR